MYQQLNWKWLSEPLVRQIAIAILSIVIIHFVARWLLWLIKHRVSNEDTRYQTHRFVTVGTYMIIALALTVVFSERLGHLTALFGFVGAGMAFALQEVILSVAGWFAVSFAGFYRVGDRVQVGGIKGDVIDIGILRTTVMETGEWVKGDLYSGRIVLIANSFVFKEPVFNYSADFPFLWDEIVLPIKYNSDYSLARRILQNVAQEITGEYASKATATWRTVVRKYMIDDMNIMPVITLAANDNWVEFTVRYVVDYKKRRITKDLLFTRILEEFDKTKGQVAMASATFQLVEMPTVNVRVNTDRSDTNKEA